MPTIDKKSLGALSIAGLLIIFFVIILLALSVEAQPIVGTVVRVLDGDTVEVDTTVDPLEPDIIRVRLIGVNTLEKTHRMPAVKRWAYYARDVVVGLTFGQQVSLETDIQLLDRYGRTLAYLYIPQPGTEGLLLNAFLLQSGYGLIGDSEGNILFRATFRLLEAEASSAKRGLWSE